MTFDIYCSFDVQPQRLNDQIKASEMSSQTPDKALK